MKGVYAGLSWLRCGNENLKKRIERTRGRVISAHARARRISKRELKVSMSVDEREKLKAKITNRISKRELKVDTLKSPLARASAKSKNLKKRIERVAPAKTGGRPDQF